MHQLITRVVGVGNRNSDGSSRQSILKKLAHPGGEVILNHVRSEEGDLSTIEVLLPGGEGKKPYCVGFLPGRIGEKIARHLDAYEDEWKATLEDPEKLRRFASFVNAPTTPDPSLAYTVERGQPRPATPDEREDSRVLIAGTVLEVRR